MMKKIITIAVFGIFGFGMAQQAPVKACCKGKSAKECKMHSKAKENCNADMKNCPMHKTGKVANHKDCNMNSHKDCTMKNKKAA